MFSRRNTVRIIVRHSVFRVFLAGCWLVIFTPEAFAYIDPGTGSFIVQVIIAAVISASVAVKMFWRNIKDFLSGRLSRQPNQDGDDR